MTVIAEGAVRAVLDSAAVLAFAFDEPQAGIIEQQLPSSAASTVTVAEVYAKLLRRGSDPERIGPLLVELGLRVERFTLADAIASAQVERLDMARREQLGEDADPHLRKQLSLGDRCCLALALRLGVPAVTADRVWADLGDPVKVQLFR